MSNLIPKASQFGRSMGRKSGVRQEGAGKSMAGRDVRKVSGDH